MAAAKETGVSKELEAAVKELLDASRKKTKDGGHEMALEDRLGVIDRAMKLELIKHKIKDAGAGSGWDEPPTGDPDGL